MLVGLATTISLSCRPLTRHHRICTAWMQALELGLSRGGGEGGEGSGGGDSLAVESRSVGSEAALRDLLNGRVDTVEFSGQARRGRGL